MSQGGADVHHWRRLTAHLVPCNSFVSRRVSITPPRHLGCRNKARVMAVRRRRLGMNLNWWDVTDGEIIDCLRTHGPMKLDALCDELRLSEGEASALLAS
jgi:hypothetical protein